MGTDRPVLAALGVPLIEREADSADLHDRRQRSPRQQGATMLAYDYPLLGLFWTFLWFFLWIAWIILLFRVFIDIFRNHKMGGFGKALWSIFVIILPFLGVLIYLIAHGKDMQQRDIDSAQAQQQAFKEYVRDAAGTSGGTADELATLADLRDRNVISAAEFEQQKAKLLA
jgi:hypothetical protein